jgi:hypothetical protein
MDQAFGPYNRSSQCVIEPMPDANKHRAADLALYIVGVIGIVAAIVFNNYS